MRILLENLHSPEKDYLRLKMVIIVWVGILIMIPIWLNFIQVYRSPLPFDTIDSLTDWNNSFKLNIWLYQKQPNNLQSIQKQVQTGLDDIFKATKQKVRLAFNVETTNDVYVPTLPGNYALEIICDSKKNSIDVQANRLLKLSLISCKSDYVSTQIVSTLTSLFIQEYKDLTSGKPAELDKMRVLKYSSQYQLLFSLAVGNPGDGIVSWDIAPAIHHYIQPLIDKFANLSTIVVSSQILNYATLSVQPSKSFRDQKAVFTLFPKDLTHFINSAEWNLASVVSADPPIHMILYIPSSDISPLQIVQSNGNPLATNSFLIPQWGGISVKNFKERYPVTQLKIDDLHPVMEIFTNQLRSLLGISPLKFHSKDSLLKDFTIKVHENSAVGVTDWELDKLIRSRAVQNVLNTISTLTSLTSMLKNLENMAVLDHITELVDTSLMSLTNATNSMLNGDFNQASILARKSIVLAEKAFFDPTMVALLYFPAEHMLAIYMPFFIPIAVPMISALSKEVKIYMAKRRKLAKKE
ncbi:phosphatidylinositol-glycan biosynthesis class S protein [Globomyces pollinis-pini]|nr:phosphatidylinositol-glycan biosynthesis class S protein [Globomyces pollinis-pini]